MENPLKIHAKFLSDALAPTKQKLPAALPVGTFQLHGSLKICMSFGHLEVGIGKTESCRNTYRGVDLKNLKQGLYRGDSLVHIYHLPVPGRKFWMGTLETFLDYHHIIFELVVPSQP